MRRQLECRVVIEHDGNRFSLGMYDPVSGRYVSLGTHNKADREKIIRDLRIRIEREGHLVTFSETSKR